MFPLVLSTRVFVQKPIVEELQTGNIQLLSAVEGPYRATFRLVFMVELLVDQDDIDNAKMASEIDPEALEEVISKFQTVSALIDGLKNPETAPELFDRMTKYGIGDVLETITKQDFAELLRFLRDEGHIDVMYQVKRPKYWTNINYDPMRGDIGKKFTDLRAGKSGRGSTADKQAKMEQVWDYLIEVGKHDLIDQAKAQLEGLQEDWKAVIFGENDSNIKIQAYKGNEKFGEVISKWREGQSELEQTYTPRDVDIDPDIRSLDAFKHQSTHGPYRKETEQHGEHSYKWEKDRIEKVMGILDKMTRSRAWQHRMQNPKVKENIRKRMGELANQLRDENERMDKKAIFAYVIIDLEPFMAELEQSFADHYTKQEDDAEYAQATHLNQEIEIWPSGLTGYKNFMVNMAAISQDSTIPSELLEVIEEAIGTSHYEVVDIDYDGNVFYKMFGGEYKHQAPEKSGTTGKCVRCGTESDDLMMHHAALGRNELLCPQCFDNTMIQSISKEPERKNQKDKEAQAMLRYEKQKQEWNESIIGIAKRIS